MKEPLPRAIRADVQKHRQDRALLSLQKAIAQYLELKGWKVVVVGGCVVQQEYGSLKHNYEFVLPFTGTKKKDS